MNPGLRAALYQLISKLPEPESVFPTRERVNWLRAAAAMFEVSYTRPDDDAEIRVYTAESGQQASRPYTASGQVL